MKHKITIEEEIVKVEKIKDLADILSDAKHIGMNRFDRKWLMVYNNAKERLKELNKYQNIKNGIHSAILSKRRGYDCYDYYFGCPHCNRSPRIKKRMYKNSLHKIINCPKCHMPVFIEKLGNFGEDNTLKDYVSGLNKRFLKHCDRCGSTKKICDCVKHTPFTATGESSIVYQEGTP